MKAGHRALVEFPRPPTESTMSCPLLDDVRRLVHNDEMMDEAELFRRYGRETALVVMDSSGCSCTSRRRAIVHFLKRLVRTRAPILPVLENLDCLTCRAGADNIHGAFPTVDSALSAAVEAGERLLLDDSEPYGLCFGIAYGQVPAADREGAFGDQMNLASIPGEDRAERDEIPLTEAAYGRFETSRNGLFQKRQTRASGLEITCYGYARPRPGTANGAGDAG
jgi:hypothetical protein